jgi:hypothetical protein
MVIKTETKYGGSAKENRDGFALVLEADVSEAQRDALAAIGLASLGYRGGASAINKALEVDSNSAAEFSDDAARKVESALEAWAAGADGKAAGFSAKGDNANPLGEGFTLSVSASRHEHGESGASPMKRATALVDSFIGTPMEEAYRNILGLPDGDRDALIAEANKRGLGISVPKGVAAKKAA